jgi:hypothetical protein
MPSSPPSFDDALMRIQMVCATHRIFSKLCGYKIKKLKVNQINQIISPAKYNIIKHEI